MHPEAYWHRAKRLAADHIWLPCGAVLAFLVAFHIAITFFVNTPLNPVSLSHADLISAYTEPLFSQRWTLFAPNPIASSRAVIVQCRGKDRRTGQAVESPWVDITTAMRRVVARHLLTPARYVLRMQLAPQEMLMPDDTVIRLRSSVCKDEPDLPPCKQPLIPPERVRLSDQMLGRVASATLKAMYGSRWRIDSVRIRLASANVPRFSRRYEPSTEPVAFMDTKWMPAPAVDPIH